MLRQINIIGCYVKDPTASAEFYRGLGFVVQPGSDMTTEVRLGSTRVQFTDQRTAQDKSAAFQKEALGEPKGTGLYVNVEVTDIDALYERYVARGYEPSSQPKDWPWGHREFALRDPDGYKLVFYEPLKS